MVLDKLGPCRHICLLWELKLWQCIRASQIIKPISISLASTSVSQYADDTTIICHKNKKSVLELFNILDSFGKISGLMVNKSKTQVMMIGPKYYDTSSIDDLCTIAKTVYILGHRRTSAGQDPGTGVSGVEFSIEEMMITFCEMSF